MTRLFVMLAGLALAGCGYPKLASKVDSPTGVYTAGPVYSGERIIEEIKLRPDGFYTYRQRQRSDVAWTAAKTGRWESGGEPYDEPGCLAIRFDTYNMSIRGAPQLEAREGETHASLCQYTDGRTFFELMVDGIDPDTGMRRFEREAAPHGAQ